MERRVPACGQVGAAGCSARYLVDWQRIGDSEVAADFVLAVEGGADLRRKVSQLTAKVAKKPAKYAKVADCDDVFISVAEYPITFHLIRHLLDIRGCPLRSHSQHGFLSPAHSKGRQRDRQKIQCWRPHDVIEKVHVIGRAVVVRHLGGSAAWERWSWNCAGRFRRAGSDFAIRAADGKYGRTANWQHGSAADGRHSATPHWKRQRDAGYESDKP
jgi:hypothetical protein